jgi:hypothetical protein
MMLEFHNVHLLRPLEPIAAPTGGLALEDRASEPSGALPPDTGLVAVDFYRSKPGELDRLVGLFEQRMRPALVEQGHPILGHLVAELAPNDFPRLPVIQDPNLLVVLSAYRDQEHYATLRAGYGGAQGDLNALLATDVETIRLRLSHGAQSIALASSSWRGEVCSPS